MNHFSDFFFAAASGSTPTTNPFRRPPLFLTVSLMAASHCSPILLCFEPDLFFLGASDSSSIAEVSSDRFRLADVVDAFFVPTFFLDVTGTLTFRGSLAAPGATFSNLCCKTVRVATLCLKSSSFFTNVIIRSMCCRNSDPNHVLDGTFEVE
jgi:hypothetical protein